MKLTDEQGQKVIDYITSKTNGRMIQCPICGNSQWTVNNIVVEMREFQNGSLILGGDSSILPFVSIACNNCAHTLLINAIAAGIVSPSNNNESNNQKEGK